MRRTRLTLRPGAPGTKKLVEQYGDRLICVRYRYDADAGTRVKTIEIVIETKPWHPDVARAARLSRFDYVHVAVPNEPGPARTALKRLGGIWHHDSQTWRITRAAAAILKITSSIVTVPPAPAPAPPPAPHVASPLDPVYPPAPSPSTDASRKPRRSGR